MKNQLSLRVVRNSAPQPRTTSKDVDIFINGVKQTNVKSLHLKIEASQVVTATLEFFPTDVEIDADVLADLQS